MLFANWLRSTAPARRIEAWAAEVAQHCQPEVAARLAATVRQMSLPEARGYIRARVAAILDQEMISLAEHLGVNPTLELAVRSQATDHIVRMTLADLLKAARPLPQRMAA